MFILIDESGSIGGPEISPAHNAFFQTLAERARLEILLEGRHRNSKRWARAILHCLLREEKASEILAPVIQDELREENS